MRKEGNIGSVGDLAIRRSRDELRFATLVIIAGLIIGLRYEIELWRLDGDGFSILSDRLPYWDFTNLWAGGLFARLGHVDWLFDLEAYRSGLRALTSPLLPNQEWSYPPSILLLGAPLSLLPIGAAYVIWTLGTILCLALAIRPFRLPFWAALCVLASPSVVTSAIFGQNGSLSAALMLASLLANKRSPIFSGLMAGLLTIKPHLGLLIPVVYLATGNWRAIGAAAVTSGLLAIGTGVAFGFSVWPSFFTITSPLMARILEAPYPQLYHANALTFFILGRSIGLSVFGAYAYQALFSFMSAITVVWLWRRESLDIGIKASLTALLAQCATPYGYSYDATPFSVAALVLFLTCRSPNRIMFCLLWLYPYFAHLTNFEGIGVGILMPAGLALYGVLCVKAGDFDRPAIAAEATPFPPDDSRPSAG